MSDVQLRRAERAVSADSHGPRPALSGTRLGLAVVGRLARKHGLNVSFRPSARGGTGVAGAAPAGAAHPARRAAPAPGRRVPAAARRLRPPAADHRPRPHAGATGRRAADASTAGTPRPRRPARTPADDRGDRRPRGRPAHAPPAAGRPAAEPPPRPPRDRAPADAAACPKRRRGRTLGRRRGPRRRPSRPPPGDEPTPRGPAVPPTRRPRPSPHSADCSRSGTGQLRPHPDTRQEHPMTGTTTDEKLNWLLESLLERTPGARHALVLSRDGLKLCRTPELSVDQADQLAAIAAGHPEPVARRVRGVRRRHRRRAVRR